MEQLNNLESTLLIGLVEKYPSLNSHVPYLNIKARTMTKSGLIVDFEYAANAEELILDDINALFSNGENIEVKGLKQGLGYVIDVTDGKISYLELVTYGENCNGKLEEYKIITD